MCVYACVCVGMSLRFIYLKLRIVEGWNEVRICIVSFYNEMFKRVFEMAVICFVMPNDAI